MPLRPRPRAAREHRLHDMSKPFLTQPTLPRRLSAHLFELAVATASVIVAVAYVIDPSHALLASPVGRDLPDYLWISWSAQSGGATETLFAGPTQPLFLTAEELPRQNARNNAVTSG